VIRVGISLLARCWGGVLGLVVSSTAPAYNRCCIGQPDPLFPALAALERRGEAVMSAAVADNGMGFGLVLAWRRRRTGLLELAVASAQPLP